MIRDTAPIGHHLVVQQINRALADAVQYAIEMKGAMLLGDESEMQRLSGAIHTASQTAQVLAHSMERRISAHRRRFPHA